MNKTNLLNSYKLPVLMRYMSTYFLKRFALILIGLTGILQLFDVLANADDILEFQDSVFGPLGTYIALRLPSILILCFPFATLLCAMMTLGKLVSSHEIIALRAVGISSYRIILTLSAALALIAGLHFLIANTILPHTSSTLRLWAENDFRATPGEEQIKDVPGWFELNGNIIKVGRASDDGDALFNVDVIQRDEEGLMTNIRTIPELRFEDGAWISRTENIKLNLPFEPAAFSIVNEYEQEMSYGELFGALLQNQYISSAQKTLHTLWLQQKFTGPLSALIMLLVAMPIAMQISRRGQIMLVASVSLLSGFSFFILERLFLTLGETAYLPPLIAVWAPFALFALLSLWVLLLLEG